MSACCVNISYNKEIAVATNGFEERRRSNTGMMKNQIERFSVKSYYVYVC